MQIAGWSIIIQSVCARLATAEIHSSVALRKASFKILSLSWNLYLRYTEYFNNSYTFLNILSRYLSYKSIIQIRIYVVYICNYSNVSIQCYNRSNTDTETKWQSLRSFAMRTEFPVSGDWRSSGMFVFTELHRPRTKLPSRVCHKRGMPRKFGMSKRTVRGPVSRLLRREHVLQCRKTQSCLHL